METQLQTLLASLQSNNTAFAQVIEFIDTYYKHQPTAFKNGDTYNEKTQNQGSARVFAFAQLNNLSAKDALYLFAEHYRAVLATPTASDHQNIRQFMMNGWEGISFEGKALEPK